MHSRLVTCTLYIPEETEGSEFNPTFQGQENLGMAMTFTLVSHLREKLAAFVLEREEAKKKEETEKERLALEVCRGVPKIRRCILRKSTCSVS
jgi:hypothetical protein